MINLYTRPGHFTDSDHPDVIRFAMQVTEKKRSAKDKAIALYYAVRDGFRYNPYHIVLLPEALKASYLLKKDYGYCVEKANLLAAAARAAGIPSRMGFADVCNHIGTEKLEQFLKTNVMVFHGYTELFIEDKWVKATPAFNKELCYKIGVAPLEFDGHTDSVFQEYEPGGGRFMEYVKDRGTYADVPFDEFVNALATSYPHLAGLVKNSELML